MKGWMPVGFFPVLRLMVGIAIFMITLPEVAIPCNGGMPAINNNACADDPYTDHHCPVNTSETTHHCALCCVFSHSFTSEPDHTISFYTSVDCGTALTYERITISNPLPDTIFHPPENL